MIAVSAETPMSTSRPKTRGHAERRARDLQRQQPPLRPNLMRRPPQRSQLRFRRGWAPVPI